jgi:hypothetical protein
MGWRTALAHFHAMITLSKRHRPMTLYLLNTTVVPCGSDGIWDVKTLPLASAKGLLARSSPATVYTSAVGHESTACIMAELLGVQVPLNRIQVTPVPGDRLLCFKLKQRAPEGVVLSVEEIEELGYEWVLMTYHGGIGAALDAKLSSQDKLINAVYNRVY